MKTKYKFIVILILVLVAIFFISNQKLSSVSKETAIAKRALPKSCEVAVPKIASVDLDTLKTTLGVLDPYVSTKSELEYIEEKDASISVYATQRYARTAQNLLQIHDYKNCISVKGVDSCSKGVFVESLLDPSVLKIHFGSEVPSLNEQMNYFKTVWTSALLKDGEVLLACNLK